MNRKAYIGNGIFIEWDGSDFILTNSYVLDEKDYVQKMRLNIDTWLALTRFVKSLEEQR